MCSLRPTKGALRLTQNLLKSNRVPRTDKGTSQVSTRPSQANTRSPKAHKWPSQASTGPPYFSGRRRALSGPRRALEANATSCQANGARSWAKRGSPQPSMVPTTTAHSVQIDEGPLKLTNDALGYVKSNMTPMSTKGHLRSKHDSLRLTQGFHGPKQGSPSQHIAFLGQHRA